MWCFIYWFSRLDKKQKNNKFKKWRWCFQYAVMVALNIEEINWNPERASNIKPFVNKCNWKRIIYSSKIDDWKTFEKNNSTTAVNIWYIKEEKLKKEKNIPAYLSKINWNFDKQMIILMIPNKGKEGKKTLAVKKLICITKRNKLKTWLWFLLLELSSFF